MQIFDHHIYEYRKGLRRLVLHTTHADRRLHIEEKLNKTGISYIVDKVSDTKINVFFGDALCIEVLRKFGSLKIPELNDEMDFILGVMLGYDLCTQCRRYLEHKESEEKRYLEVI